MDKRSISALFIGIAEVKLPLKQLPPERMPFISQLAYKKIVDSNDLTEEEEIFMSKSIGEIDDQYGLQEVRLEICDNQCLLKKGDDAILRHRLRDVIYGSRVENKTLQIIYITRSDNFGRAAVVLTTRSTEIENEILEALNIEQPECKSVKKKFQSFLQPRRQKPIRDAGITKSISSSISDDECSDDEDSIQSVEDEKDSRPLIAIESVDLKMVPKTESMTPLKAEIHFLLEQEREYLNKLILLDKSKEMMDNAPQEIKNCSPQLFTKVKELKNLHESLKSSLEECDSDVQKICQSFLKFKNDYQHYVTFIENIENTEEITVRFSDYFRENIPNLIDNLRRPRMRLNHYVLILESLQKKCPDIEAIGKAVAMFKDYLKLADRGLLLKSVQNCPFDLTAKGELLVSSILKCTRPGDIHRRTYFVIFLKEEFVITKGTRGNYTYIDSFNTSEIEVKGNIYGLYFSIFVRSRQPSKYTFKAKTVKLQAQWRTALEETLQFNNYIEARPGARRRTSSLTYCQSEEIRKISISISESENEGEGSPWLRRKGVKKKSTYLRTLSNMQIESDSISTAGSPRRNAADTIYLTVWTLFYQYKVLYSRIRPHSIRFPEDNHLTGNSEVIDKENEYIEMLHSSTLVNISADNNATQAPLQLVPYLEILYIFHKDNFLPLLQKQSCNSSMGLLDCILYFHEELIDLYSNYFVNRIMLQNQMQELELSSPHILPIRHLEHYIETVLSYNQYFPNAQPKIKESLKVLYNVITKSNICLIEQQVDGIPFSLETCGPIILCDSVKVKVQNRKMQEYQAVFFPDIIILLEQKSPKYSYFEKIRLDSVGLGPQNDDKYAFQIELRITSITRKNYLFKFKKTEDREAWISSVRKILDEQQNKLKDTIVPKEPLKHNVKKRYLETSL